jgi:hypothetical protein
LEWYDPQQGLIFIVISTSHRVENSSEVTTQNGSLRLILSEVDPVNNHNLKYRSGMVSSKAHFFFVRNATQITIISSSRGMFLFHNCTSAIIIRLLDPSQE